MKKISFDIDGEIVTGFTEKVGKDTWVRVNNKTFKAEQKTKNKNKSNSSSLVNPNEILAPMPGKITDIKKKTNDSVKSGDIVIVMEAMKMEYSLKANKNGEIKSIKIKEGDQVILGQLLAEIK